MIDVVIATGNPHKLRELRRLLAGLPLRLLAPDELPNEQRFHGAEETGSTFDENADIKAAHAARSSGLHALADDSGLEVDALEGRPGVHSARYAGEPTDDAANNAKLVAEARAAGLVEPPARFRCVVSLAAPDGGILLRGHGACAGVLVHEPRGSGGFGYDPHFLVPELGKTFAETSADEKNAVSHRARALADLRSRIGAWLALEGVEVPDANEANQAGDTAADVAEETCATETGTAESREQQTGTQP